MWRHGRLYGLNHFHQIGSVYRQFFCYEKVQTQISMTIQSIILVNIIAANAGTHTSFITELLPEFSDDAFFDNLMQIRGCVPVRFLNCHAKYFSF